jgi:hypothetical protein
MFGSIIIIWRDLGAGVFLEESNLHHYYREVRGSIIIIGRFGAPSYYYMKGLGSIIIIRRGRAPSLYYRHGLAPSLLYGGSGLHYYYRHGLAPTLLCGGSWRQRRESRSAAPQKRIIPGLRFARQGAAEGGRLKAGK